MRGKELNSRMNDRRLEFAAIATVILVWAALHWAFRNVFIFHDAWNFNFPLVYEVAKNSACGRFAFWLSSDTGSPTLIYALSYSLTQVFRIVLINWWACTHPAPFDAMLFYKAQIFLIYLGFASGTYVLGRVLFRHWLSALYLMAAVLFAGACLDSMHSDQVAVLMFWVPWCAAALAMAVRHSAERRGFFYINLGAVFFCVQLLDMYPHIPALAAAYAAAIYLALWPMEALRTMVRLAPRLWPASIVVLVTVAALYAIHHQIFDFQPHPSRTEIKVVPSQFGQTGFMQLSAFFGSLFPLTFTHAFEEIASRYVWRGFIYRLDVLMVYLGTIPLWLILALLPRRGFGRAALGWLIFAFLLLLTSLQSSGFYFAIFHLPFFDLFRSYFHFFDYALIGFLVVSAYGFDRIAASPAADRAAVFRATLLLGVGLFALGAAALVVFVSWAKGHGPGLPAYTLSITVDAAIILIAFGAIYACTRQAISAGGAAILTVAGLVLSQSIHAAGVYGLLGEPAQATFARYKLDQRMLTPLDAAEWDMPGGIMRVPCQKSAGCNLAKRPAASLRTDTDGSFFRDRQSPVLRLALPADVKSALAGVTHPILWATGAVTVLPSIEALDRALAQYRGEASALLTRTTYVVDPVREDAAATPSAAVAAPPPIEFAGMKVSPNRVSFRYRAGAEGYANLSLTAAPGWSARVNAAEAPIIRGYYNYITVKLPPEEGDVTLEYRDFLGGYFFYSRTVLAMLALIGAAVLARRALSGRISS